MKHLLFAIMIAIVIGCNAQSKPTIPMKPLTLEERHVIVDKGTERPFTGKYYDNQAHGLYVCKQCELPLYRSEDKFDARCGWPSFDAEITGAVRRSVDADGRRTEITCARCGAHLGHVFEGEGFTPNDTRHCVNSISMNFIPHTAQAIFAGGCFWGVEHLMTKQAGVIGVESGYIGGVAPNPTYKEVCTGTTGYAEAVRITYNPSRVTYQTLAKLFFEIHDPTQSDRQGPDVGSQYRTEVFYQDAEQKAVADSLITQLRAKGYDVKTQVTPATTFYPAEEYHQDYYVKTGKQPYCHTYTPRF